MSRDSMCDGGVLFRLSPNSHVSKLNLRVSELSQTMAILQVMLWKLILELELQDND